MRNEDRRNLFFDATYNERHAAAAEALRTGNIRTGQEHAARQAFFTACQRPAEQAHLDADHAVSSRDAPAQPPRRGDRRLVYCSADAAQRRIERFGPIRVAAELVERHAYFARVNSDQAEPIAAADAEAPDAVARSDERRARLADERRIELAAAAAAAEDAYPAADRAAATVELARFAELNRRLAQLHDGRNVTPATSLWRAARWRVHQQEHAEYSAARHAESARSDAATASRRQQDEYSAARCTDARRDDARRADAATTIEAARHADRLRAAERAAAAAENDAADAVPWGIDVGDWRRQRDAEAVRQRDAQVVRAEVDAVAIDVDAEDDAAPWAIDVAAYRRQLERRQRDADALAAIAAANERNLAEIVDHPLDASARRAEIAADARLSASQDAAAAEQSVVPVATAAAEHAAAAAEVDAANIALWENAYNVDIVDGEVVAMWNLLPGLQDDPASAAADLLATQRADALTAQAKLEANDFTCTCPLCFNAKNLQILNCGHEICRDCIPRILPPVCPMCRSEL